MPGALTHSPADVVRTLLIQKGYGVSPGSEPWPIYASSTPDMPDRIITVLDMDGSQHGRVQVGGERQEHHGLLILVRAGTHTLGYTKTRELAVALDEDVYLESVVISETHYLVHAITRTTDVQARGKESPDSKRSMFAIEALVSLRQV